MVPKSPLPSPAGVETSVLREERSKTGTLMIVDHNVPVSARVCPPKTTHTFSLLSFSQDILLRSDNARRIPDSIKKRVKIRLRYQEKQLCFALTNHNIWDDIKKITISFIYQVPLKDDNNNNCEHLLSSCHAPAVSHVGSHLIPNYV